ncbi:MAG: Asp-tRNA(Asn)/Glu-tRNA(Gln) amidotransferase subunit GatB [Paracoccaceae bacterium]|nr:Asp-tRNA(Asn)/Glu-tRNA(Gln) amidotransferase subunit GatB [Paracoccaceae bacterium]
MLDLTYEAPEPTTISGAKYDWEVVIGLEVHAQVASKAKLFSGASTLFGAEPNSNVAFVDAGMPGMLPVINVECISQAVKTGLGLNAQINLYSAFDRKNYFYPDLPQGYQISQLYHPIVGQGEVLVNLEPGVAKIVRIERIHLEQDAGKSIHDMDPNTSFVDLNRTGVALMEIVSKPDIRSAEEATAYISKLRQIMRYLGTCDGNMQNGNLRADVNISVCKPGDYEKYQTSQDFSYLGTRCEIKNMNSLKFIQQAIDTEARRQIGILEAGGTISQETRLYDPDKGETRPMRSKEEAHDYRYFPCPDLLPLNLKQEWVDNISSNLIELPDQKRLRFANEYMLSDYDAGVLTADLETSKYFEAVAKGRDQKLSANWVINELFGRLKRDTDKSITDSPITHSQLGEIIDLITSSEISGKIAKDLFEIVYTEGGSPSEIVDKRGMRQVSNAAEIESALDIIIRENPDQVTKAKANPKLAGWFVGQVMKSTGGKANPKLVNELVQKKLVT